MSGPYDYAREIHDARKAEPWWRYPEPGQMGVDGEWHEPGPEDIYGGER